MHVWDQFSYRVFWSPEDREYVGVCAEMSGLSWLAKTPEEALRGIRCAAREGVKLLEEDGDRA
jgi:predicted RNase H-like HicB family nuclease